MAQAHNRLNSSRMGEMPEGRLLLSMDIPMMLSMLVQALYNVVDSIYVARVSEDCLSALSLAFPAQNIMIGLGLFTVVGVQVAQTASVDTNSFLVTFVGVLTDVGGGILRDVFAGNMPYAFIKHFYACASIIGAWACALLWPVLGDSLSMLVGAALTVILRLLAAHHHWSLPKAK